MRVLSPQILDNRLIQEDVIITGSIWTKNIPASVQVVAMENHHRYFHESGCSYLSIILYFQLIFIGKILGIMALGWYHFLRFCLRPLYVMYDSFIPHNQFGVLLLPRVPFLRLDLRIAVVQVDLSRSLIWISCVSIFWVAAIPDEVTAIAMFSDYLILVSIT